MSRPFPPRSFTPPAPFARVNGKIRAREVRVIDTDKKMLGVLPLNEAINMARTHGVDLVEIVPNAVPPVCRLVDFGKYRYEQAKQEKESRKHQHANKVKEVQLSPNIDPHDFGVKLQHAIEFLCEEMKVKVTLRFRGREMAHKEFGFQQVEKFIKELTPFAHPDAPPKLIGKGINVMLSPLPRNKRAKNPKQSDRPTQIAPTSENGSGNGNGSTHKVEIEGREPVADKDSGPSSKQFGNNAFANLELKTEGA